MFCNFPNSKLKNNIYPILFKQELTKYKANFDLTTIKKYIVNIINNKVGVYKITDNLYLNILKKYNTQNEYTEFLFDINGISIKDKNAFFSSNIKDVNILNIYTNIGINQNYNEIDIYYTLIDILFYFDLISKFKDSHDIFYLITTISFYSNNEISEFTNDFCILPMFLLCILLTDNTLFTEWLNSIHNGFSLIPTKMDLSKDKEYIENILNQFKELNTLLIKNKDEFVDILYNQKLEIQVKNYIEQYINEYSISTNKRNYNKMEYIFKNWLTTLDYYITYLEGILSK